MLILRMGSMLSVGFEQIYMLQNSAVFDVSDVISTYEYRVGLEQRQYSITTALSFFKGVVGLILVFGTNSIAKKTRRRRFVVVCRKESAKAKRYLLW
ncbi:MAG: hypothetical protein L6V93_22560 [Clostridiales bacterium]|nr:MAG: hypothetical protein L6V93_22560 [Clostridiales bacterium]